MKTLSNYVALILLSAFLSGCAGIAPGENEVIVNAERTVKIAEVAIETFLEMEKGNRQALWDIDHDIKHYADAVRLYQLEWITGAYRAILIWKSDESEGNLNNVKVAIVVLDKVLTDIAYFQSLGNLNVTAELNE